EGLDEAGQLWRALTFWPSAPYPASEVIKGFELDWTTHRRAADGSGDWGSTWADDDHLYTAWGNGGGFGGSNVNGRVYLGFARIEGSADDYQAYNVWGGHKAENPAEFGGKAYSLLSVDGLFYMWRCGDSDGDSSLDFQELFHSANRSATWRSTGVKFDQQSFADGGHGFYCPVFLQYGRDYAGARDDFVYIYAPEIQQTASLYPQVPGEVALMRVPKTMINIRSSYEFFAGMDADGEPIWAFDGSQRVPVFSDPENGITQHISAVYNPGLDRYILTTEHSDHAEGNIGVYEGPTPWGPWATVHFSDSFGRFETLDNGFMWVFPSKWLSEDGKDFVMIYTGKGRNDSWNTVEGRFLLADGND
ncbi:MAG: DUF4185 domain-containing protein, partial [Alphaproteobacteria bacterium]|nr:DUF4185 domain-containing protein [Alphaproteobacteria bacterium]